MRLRCHWRQSSSGADDRARGSLLAALDSLHGSRCPERPCATSRCGRCRELRPGRLRGGTKSTHDTRHQIWTGGTILVLTLVLSWLIGAVWSDGEGVRAKAIVIALIGAPVGLWMLIDGLVAQARGPLWLGLAQRGAVGVHEKSRRQFTYPYDSTPVTIEVDGGDAPTVKATLKGRQNVVMGATDEAGLHRVRRVVSRFRQGHEELTRLGLIGPRLTS